MLFQVPPYLLPTPLQIFQAFYQNGALIFHHFSITLFEITVGFFIGAVLAVFLAAASCLWPRVRAIVMPFALIKQATPTFVIAPLLVLWTGYGFTAKIIITALMVYFPILSATYDGLRHTQNDWLDLAKCYGASPWQTLIKLRFPAAFPGMASGFAIAVSIAPMGAVIGEWVGSHQGLGFLLTQANVHVETDLLFATVFVLASLTLCLSFLNKLFWNWLTPWKQDA